MPLKRTTSKSEKGRKQNHTKTKGKHSKKVVDKAAIEYQAFTLRRDGAMFREIAEFQKCSTTTAYHRVVNHLNEIRRHSQETLEQIKAMDDAALQRAKLELMNIITGRDSTKTEKMKAVHALARVCERRAKMHGLDAPVRIEEQIDASFTSTVQIDYSVLSDEDLAAIAEVLDRASIGGGKGEGGEGPQIVEGVHPPRLEGDPSVN